MRHGTKEDEISRPIMVTPRRRGGEDFVEVHCRADFGELAASYDDSGFHFEGRCSVRLMRVIDGAKIRL